MVAGLTVVVISQCVQILDRDAAHLKLICYLSVMPQSNNHCEGTGKGVRRKGMWGLGCRAAHRSHEGLDSDGASALQSARCGCEPGPWVT